MAKKQEKEKTIYVFGDDSGAEYVDLQRKLCGAIGRDQLWSVYDTNRVVAYDNFEDALDHGVHLAEDDTHEVTMYKLVPVKVFTRKVSQKNLQKVKK